MNEKNTSADTYVLGRRQEETRRLQVQAQVRNPVTRRLFELAGIMAGMKVLDVGSGAGDVALLLADITHGLRNEVVADSERVEKMPP